MRKRVLEVFFELIKNSRKSDREIAKKLNISQPTVTRIRKKLEKNTIKAYTAIPVLPEIGIELISFNFGRCDNPQKDIEVCLRKLAKVDPKITFVTSGEGMSKNCLMIAFHKNYKEYAYFLTNVRKLCRGVKTDFDSFLAPTSKDHNLDFSSPIINLMKEKK